ncbi:MAG: efflux RND transporter periplasmic adaptor subunit [Methylocystaceae bacterium]|nr:efflux RND transporter periplasmic adaptor subunit [Methylocystaceae bacterium]
MTIKSHFTAPNLKPLTKLFALSLYACALTLPHQSMGADPVKKTALPVITKPVVQSSDDRIIKAIGTSRAVRSVTLYSKIDGDIAEIVPREEQMVAAQDVIIKLDNRNASLSARLAETQLKAAEIALRRAQQLRKNNVRSSANVEDAQIGVEKARIELLQAKEVLKDHTLRAPFAGFVGIAKVEVGDRITTDQPIITLDDRSTLIIEFGVAENYLSRLKKDMAITAQSANYPPKTIKGVIERIDSRVDPVSRTVLVRAAFANPLGDLLPGMSFAITLKLPGDDFLAVPELALQWRDGKSYVWRIDGDIAKRVEVLLVRRLNNNVLVQGDLKAGDRVVVEGVQRLRDGRSVQSIDAEGS